MMRSSIIDNMMMSNMDVLTYESNGLGWCEAQGQGEGS